VKIKDIVCLVLMVLGCSSGGDKSVDVVEVKGEVADARPAEVEVREELANTPVEDPEAAARAFQLYYRERVERSVVSYNRFMLFGGVNFGTTIGKAGVARSGDKWEIVVGPNDNNQIGESVRGVWYAYKIYRSRLLALSLIRMLEGMVFFEAVSGHAGLTARMVYPGWTMSIDGATGTAVRTRHGDTVLPPTPYSVELEAEILSALFGDFNAVYREEPEDILLNYMPVKEIAPYAITYSHSMTPDYLRVSDCCTSLMQVPDGYPWAGGWFGNHNSRDNFPDLAAGYLVALEVLNDPDVDDDLRETAERAWSAGQRIGDLVQANEGRLMTVSEHTPYSELVVAGGVRPDGETEAEDLGSISDCQMAFLARALSSEGLALPLPELPAPGSVEFLLADVLGESCPVPEPVRTCTRIQEAYCGKDWSTIGELELLGIPWLEAVKELEKENPGSAKSLIGSFQDDFHEKTIAALELVRYADTKGDVELADAARKALGEITQLSRFFGELLYAQTSPSEYTERLYSSALFDALGGLPVNPANLGDYGRADWQMTRLEQILELPDTEPEALRTDEEILATVEADLGGKSESVKARYLEHYGATPPLRRTANGYEATGHHSDHDWPWAEVPPPRHFQFGGVRLLEALPLCITAPHLLDCTWAKLGCARPDLDGSGAVDAADQALFDAASAGVTGTICNSANSWCNGADLDQTGSVDDTDRAFMAAAMGCRY
jgi:hypothetical protein